MLSSYITDSHAGTHLRHFDIHVDNRIFDQLSVSAYFEVSW